MSVGLKICGITRRQDLAVCEQLGVDAVGINLWRGSKRGVTLDGAAEVLRDATHRCARVGVFVEATPDEVAAAAAHLKLDAVQWHGDGPVQPYAALGLPYVWVIRGTPELDSLSVPSPAPKWILLDAAVDGFGGAGTKTDWGWAADAVAHLKPLPAWLAGGLHPDNAAEAIAKVAPAGLDVATGAEAQGAKHGEKDRKRIETLLAACR